MIRLCMDTSHRYLVLAIIKDDQLIASYQQYAWKKQSETIFVELIKLMDSVNLKADDIDEVVITKGPGSYTGIRIAMTIAKVFCTTKNKALKTISTLQLYAGTNDVSVILDARSNRVYYGKYQHGVKCEESIKTLDEIKQLNETFIGDVDLIDYEVKDIDFAKNFVDLIPYYETVENIHTLTPEYLKDESEYLK